MAMTNDENQSTRDQLLEKNRIIEARKKRALAKQNALVKNENKQFSKKRTRLLIQLGAEWLRIANEKVTSDSNLESLLQSEIEYMELINRLFPRCPKCKKTVLLKVPSQKNPDKFYWKCPNKCGFSPVWDKNGQPDLEKK